MSREAAQESEHGGPPAIGHESSSGASDFEDSVLWELRQSEPLLPLPGEVLGGPDGRRYEVLEWMGGGGMGQVFRARDETLRREVALKLLLPRPGFEAEALTEARAVARLDHENIVRIFDVSVWKGMREEPGVPFLVMECLEGEPLSARDGSRPSGKVSKNSFRHLAPLRVVPYESSDPLSGLYPQQGPHSSYA